jgi:alpha-L-rhamnosidase
MAKAQLVLTIVSAASIAVICGCDPDIKIFNRTAPRQADNLTPAYLRCEYRVNPLGIDQTSPRLSWVVQSARRAQKQSAYRILAASTEALLADGKPDLWDSGKVESDQTNQIIYAGKALQSQMRCHWKVMVWDAGDNPSGWSDPALWTMGLLKPADWKARWISLDSTQKKNEASILEDSQWIWYPEDNPAQNASVGTRYFRTMVTIPAGPGLKRAILKITADNSFVAFVNGQQVGIGDNFKKPQALDIKKYLVVGENAIAVAATNTGDDANPAGLVSMVLVEFEDEPAITIFTGTGGWKTANIEAPGWKDAGFDDSAWANPKVLGKVGIKPWGKLTTTMLNLPAPRYMRKNFDAKTGAAIRRATVYATALGLYELHINARKVGDEYFSPGWTDYDKRVYYKTYDVTDMINESGSNTIGAILADGWYVGYIGFGAKRRHYGSDKPYLKAQLHIEYADGTTRIIATDDTWKAATGPILEADFLMGETYDANKEISGWSECGFDDTAWRNVLVGENTKTMIEAFASVPVRVFQEITPVKTTEPQKGHFVFDMGTNFAGFARLKVKGGKGTKIVIRFAERLNPDGTIYTTNLRGARATDTYICKGDGEEIWQPKFTFHGFQYVELTGYPGKPGRDAITGIELTSDTPPAGAFESSDATANRLYRNITQTQRANFIEIPTDCPQRDERLGWMGDAQIYARTATYNTDISAFFTKWLVDVEDAQLETGAFSDVAPRKVALGGGVAAWGDAGVICPWTIYQVYGDTRILARHYDAMARWIDYCKGAAKDLLRPATGYGDWLSIKADTPKDVLATAYFAHSTHLMSQIAAVLDKQEDAAKYNELFEQIKAAFNKAYINDDGRIKGDTQTDYVLALAFDLLDADKQTKAGQHLVDNIEARDWHLSTGFVGTKDLMTTLTNIGRTDAAYRLYHNDTFPSWGFSIKHGATSIWERWDGWTPDKGFQDPGMNSFAHYSFGAVAEWMFRTIGGIDTDGPGYRNIIIRPIPGGRLNFAKASYNSINGLIATDWKLGEGSLRLNVTIPANTTATIYIPATGIDNITESGNPADRATGVEFLRMHDNAAVCRIGSGTYSFASRGAAPVKMPE